MRNCGRSMNRQVRQRDWNEVDGENWEVASRDMVRHTHKGAISYTVRKAMNCLSVCSYDYNRGSQM